MCVRRMCFGLKWVKFVKLTVQSYWLNICSVFVRWCGCTALIHPNHQFNYYQSS